MVFYKTAPIVILNLINNYRIGMEKYEFEKNIEYKKNYYKCIKKLDSDSYYLKRMDLLIKRKYLKDCFSIVPNLLSLDSAITKHIVTMVNDCEEKEEECRKLALKYNF